MDEKITSIEKLNVARQLLSEAKNLDDILHIRDIAEAARVYAQAAKLGLENQNEAAEVKIRAERKAGEMLAQIEKQPGARNDIEPRNTMLQGVMKNADIDRMQSSRWQAIASLPEEVFEEHIAETKAEGKELTTAGVIKEAKKIEREELISKQREDIINNNFESPSKLYDVIVIDPPWDYGTQYDPEGRRAANPYPEMTLEEIGNIELPSSDDCVLWLWTTHKYMRHAFDIIDQWGFRDVAIVTWVKNRIGLGSWLRSQSEFCIMCVKGKPKVNLTNQSTVIHGELREHSRKPDEFYKMVDELCNGYKIDWFSREFRDGWAQFGNDKEKF